MTWVSDMNVDACYLVRGGGLLGVLVFPLPKKAREPDADAAVWLLSDLSDGSLVHGGLGQIRALHLPHLQQDVNFYIFRFMLLVAKTYSSSS